MKLSVFTEKLEHFKSENTDVSVLQKVFQISFIYFLFYRQFKGT